MTYDPKQHHRRSIRWFAYDYTQAGAYFVTVCTQGWLCLFGDVSGDSVRLNDAGRMVQDAWDELAGHYAGVQTDAFVVMPNHIHGIILLDPVRAGPCACPNRACPDGDPGVPGSGNHGGLPQPGPCPALALGDVVGRFKSLTTARYIREVKHSGWPAFAGRL
ncbi:MAG: hypothetical protein JW993_01470 [Sedimentisphaerales bacterium]|nr:hypothetical protein [Sedimentisphaerales bacterium]